MRKLLLTLPFLPSMAVPQQAGWGSVGQQEEKGFSWTDPLWPDFWMAWTPATLAVFVGIFSAIALIGCAGRVQVSRRDRAARRAGPDHHVGRPVVHHLLGSAYIFLAWLGLVGQPVWTPLFLSIGWGVFVFWKV